MMRQNATAAVLACMACVSVSQADIFVLKKTDTAPGARLEGELLNPRQTPRETYVIRTGKGTKLTLTKGQVEEVILKSDAQKWYERWLPEMPNTARGNLIMAAECTKRGLKAQREKHLEDFLRFEPDNLRVRRLLGYRKLDGKWQQPEDYWSQRGYVRYKGDWRLAQEVEALKRDEQRTQEEKKWRKQIRTWRTWVIKGRKRAEGERKLRAIDDRRADVALADQLEKNDEPDYLKMIYIDVLGKLKRTVGVQAFINRALFDRNDRIRERCLDELSQHGTKQAVKGFVAKLNHENPKVINRAAIGLAYLGDPLATKPLIEALVTEHKRLVKPKGNVNAGRGPGGNAFQFGAKPYYYKWKEENRDVLTALTTLNRGVNFLHNEQAWRDWYAAKKTPRTTNLRRDQ